MKRNAVGAHNVSPCWTRKIFGAVLPAVLLWALLIFGCGDDGNPTGGKDGPPVLDLATYDADYAVFKKAMADALKTAKDFDAKELAFQARSVYAFVGASLSSARFAVENVLAQKNAGTLAQVTAGSRYASWDTIAAINYASPFPYYFEGLLAHIEGRNSEAIDLYVNAMLNPAYPDSGISFYYLNGKDVTELGEIRDELRTLENEVYALYTPTPILIERDEYTFYPAYLRASSREALEAGDKSAAVAYAKNAVMVDPFDGANYKSAVVTLMAAEDFVSAVEYLDAGLTAAPDDDGLKLLYNILKETTERAASGLSKRAGVAAAAFVPWGAGSLEGVDYRNIHYEPRSEAEKQAQRDQDKCFKDLTEADVDAIIKSVMNARQITSGMLINAIALINQMGKESFGWDDVAHVAGELMGVNDAIALYDIVMGNSKDLKGDIQDYLVSQGLDKLKDAADAAVGTVTVKVGAKLGIPVSPLNLFFKAIDLGKIASELWAKYERIEDAMKTGEERIKMLEDFYAACNIEIEIAVMNSEEYDCCDDLDNADAQAECKCAKEPESLECICRANPDDPRCDPCEEAPGTLTCFCRENPEHGECKIDPCVLNPNLPECEPEPDPCEENPDLPECAMEFAAVFYRDAVGSQHRLCFADGGARRRWEGINDGNRGIFIHDEISGNYYAAGYDNDLGWMWGSVLSSQTKVVTDIYFRKAEMYIYLDYYNMLPGATKTTTTIAGRVCDLYTFPELGQFAVWNNTIMMRIADSGGGLIEATHISDRGCSGNAFTQTVNINWGF